MRRYFIGTSGWNYKHWRDTLYNGIKVKDWFAHYCEHFDTVEINATFYRLQARSTFEKWRDQAPAGFLYSIKGNKYLTRYKRLAEPEESLLLEKERADGMGGKLSVVLWQLPASFKKDAEKLSDLVNALGRLWPEMRFAIEFRHKSWFDDEVAAILRENGIANCISHASRWPMWEAVTADFAYIRLHGRPYTYYSNYEEDELRSWTEKITTSKAEEFYVYFDNDANSFAPMNALRLRELLAPHARGQTGGTFRGPEALNLMRPNRP